LIEISVALAHRVRRKAAARVLAAHGGQAQPNESIEISSAGRAWASDDRPSAQAALQEIGSVVCGMERCVATTKCSVVKRGLTPKFSCEGQEGKIPND
jgi:hypothetical protein